MRKRIIHEQEIVDLDTGEVKSVTKTSLRGNDESFGMYRTTAGFEWMVNLTGLELKLMMILVANKNRRNNFTSFITGMVEEVADLFGVSSKAVKNTLRSLRQKSIIKEVTRSSYLVNPLTYYSGGTNNWKSQYEEYEDVEDLKYNRRVKETPLTEATEVVSGDISTQ